MGAEQKENIRDYILNTRDILKTQLNIEDKRDETERLSEYIMMEQQKLQSEIQEFNRMVELKKQHFIDEKEAEDTIIKEIGIARKEKKQLVNTIEHMNNQLYKIENQMKKADENLVECKFHKHFLDILGIQSGKKKFNPKTENTLDKQVSTPEKGSRKATVRVPRGGDSTFITGTDSVQVSSVNKT